MKRLVAMVVLGTLADLAFMHLTPRAQALPAQQATATDTPSGPSVTVLPPSVNHGDYLTVIAQHLSVPVNQYCVYFDSQFGPRPLAHFVPPGYGEQISPLVPGGDSTTGIGAYQTWLGVTGAFRVMVASCTYGAEPKSIQPVASTDFTIGSASSAPPFGIRAIGATPLGQPFTLTVPARHQATCLYLVPEDVFDGVHILPGVTLRAGATSAYLSIPASMPWGVYQIFWTAAAGRTCPQTQLRAGAILASAGWAPGRWTVRMESQGVPSAGSGLSLHVDRNFDASAATTPVCLAVWSAGTYSDVSKTFAAQTMVANSTVRLPLPVTVTGEATITATNGACPSGSPPTHADAYTVTAITGRAASPPMPVPQPTPAAPPSPAGLASCPLLPGSSASLARESANYGKAAAPPGLVLSTYLGHGVAQSTAVAVDRQGDVLVTLASAGKAGHLSGCLAELNSAGSRVLFAVAIPGAPRAVALDQQGNIWLTGDMNGPGFVMKLNSTGKLLFTLTLGGRLGASGYAVAVDGSGNAYISGSTSSPDFPTTRGVVQPAYNSPIPGCPPTCQFLDSRGFVVKVGPDGHVLYSTYLGPAGSETDGIAVDAAGNAYVNSSASARCGKSGPSGTFVPASVIGLSPDGKKFLLNACLTRPKVPSFGAMSGPVVLDGERVIVGESGFLAAVDRKTGKLSWERAIPGHVSAVTVDPNGRIDLTGITDSPTFPVSRPIQAHFHKATCGIEEAAHTCTDAFVTQLSASGTLLFSTYLGGTREDAGYGVASTGSGEIVVSGSTSSNDFPLSRALQPKNQGGGGKNSYAGGKLDGFLTEINAG